MSNARDDDQDDDQDDGHNEADNFIEVSARGVEKALFHCELSWTVDDFPFGADFESRLALCLGVFQKFFLEGHDDFPAMKGKGMSSLFLPISLVDDEQMREINREHRDKDKTTDVLSFPLYESLRSGEELIFEELEFGDIIISVPVMKKQAQEFEVSLEGEFFHLLTHGFLHLCGYDHEVSAEEEEIMEAHEQRLIKDIYTLIAMD